MKKLFKYLGIGLLGIIIVIGGFLIFVAISDIPSYEVQNLDYKSKSTPQALERGAKLTQMLCAGCHLNSETGKLTGKKMADVSNDFGSIYAQNITQDKNYGIGNWSDGEILYLLRTGIKKNGQYSPPYMTKLPNMADEDVNAIIAFLKSDNAMVQADPTPDTPCEPSFLTKFLSRVAFKPFPMPENIIQMPDSTNSLELGEYLAHNLDCYSCHSADFKTIDELNPKLSEEYFAGGNILHDYDGNVIITPNLTPDKETGIGDWSKEDFIVAVKYGRKKGEKALQYPMLPYTALTDKEAGAIYDYLQNIPPINKKIERSIYN